MERAPEKHADGTVSYFAGGQWHYRVSAVAPAHGTADNAALLKQLAEFVGKCKRLGTTWIQPHDLLVYTDRETIRTTESGILGIVARFPDGSWRTSNTRDAVLYASREEAVASLTGSPKEPASGRKTVAELRDQDETSKTGLPAEYRAKQLDLVETEEVLVLKAPPSPAPKRKTIPTPPKYQGTQKSLF